MIPDISTMIQKGAIANREVCFLLPFQIWYEHCWRAVVYDTSEVGEWRTSYWHLCVHADSQRVGIIFRLWKGLFRDLKYDCRSQPLPCLEYCLWWHAWRESYCLCSNYPSSTYWLLYSSSLAVVQPDRHHCISLSSVIGTLGITFVGLRLVPLHEMYPWTVISSQRAKRESSQRFHPYDHVLQGAISEG